MRTFILLVVSLTALSNALVLRQAPPAQPTAAGANSGTGGLLTTTANAAVNSAPYTVPINTATYFWTSVSIIPGKSKSGCTCQLVLERIFMILSCSLRDKFVRVLSSLAASPNPFPDAGRRGYAGHARNVGHPGHPRHPAHPAHPRNVDSHRAHHKHHGRQVGPRAKCTPQQAQQQNTKRGGAGGCLNTFTVTETTTSTAHYTSTSIVQTTQVVSSTELATETYTATVTVTTTPKVVASTEWITATATATITPKMITSTIWVTSTQMAQTTAVSSFVALKKTED
ncbi:hypothetical protein BKA82DRAFT_8910 [Pisolithus tinctorius]|nr:hypothetical protein BKA82DRAFT_8910 [Pisolithus tinctorius]